MGTFNDWTYGDSLVSFYCKAGFSNRGADLDNVIKPLLDTLQCLYEGFNDNKVYRIVLDKDIVKKGEEYLEIRIKLHEEDHNDSDDGATADCLNGKGT